MLFLCTKAAISGGVCPSIHPANKLWNRLLSVIGFPGQEFWYVAGSASSFMAQIPDRFKEDEGLVQEAFKTRGRTRPKRRVISEHCVS